MSTDTSEKGLEALIARSLVDDAGYVLGDPKDYDRDHAVDVPKLLAFLRATQPEAVTQLGLEDEAKRLKFLHRLQGEVAKRGVIDVLRSGVKDGPVSVELFFGTPSAANAKAVELHAANIFSVTRQLRYAKDGGAQSLDMATFINGLPILLDQLDLPDELFGCGVDLAQHTVKVVSDCLLLGGRRYGDLNRAEFGLCHVHEADDAVRVILDPLRNRAQGVEEKSAVKREILQLENVLVEVCGEGPIPLKGTE